MDKEKIIRKEVRELNKKTTEKYDKKHRAIVKKYPVWNTDYLCALHDLINKWKKEKRNNRIKILNDKQRPIQRTTEK